MTRLDWQEVAERALHPLQVVILTHAASAGTTSAKAVWEATGGAQSLGLVAYHVRQLERKGFLRLKSTRQVRGAMAHDYVLAKGLVR